MGQKRQGGADGDEPREVVIAAIAAIITASESEPAGTPARASAQPAAAAVAVAMTRACSKARRDAEPATTWRIKAALTGEPAREAARRLGDLLGGACEAKPQIALATGTESRTRRRPDPRLVDEAQRERA